MLDFNVTKPGTPPELRPALTMFAAVIAQSVKDAGAPSPKKTRKELGGGAGHLTDADIRSAVFFLFYPGRLERFADMVGFDAESFRAHLICGTASPWAADRNVDSTHRDRIRSRAIKYGFLEEVQHLDELWSLRHAR